MLGAPVSRPTAGRPLLFLLLSSSSYEPIELNSDASSLLLLSSSVVPDSSIGDSVLPVGIFDGDELLAKLLIGIPSTELFLRKIEDVAKTTGGGRASVMGVNDLTDGSYGSFLITKLFSKNLFNSTINISLAPGSVSRKIYRILRDSGIIRIERTNETETNGKFYLVCQRDRLDSIRNKAQIIYDFLMANPNPESTECTSKFTLVPRVNGSSRRFVNISPEYIAQLDSSVQKGAKIPRQISVVNPTPVVNQWKQRPNIARRSIPSSIASSPRCGDNNAADDEQMTTTSGLTNGETQSVKTVLTQFTELRSQFAELKKQVDETNELRQKEDDNRREMIEKERTDRENEEAARRLQREQEQKKEREEREKEEERCREQRAQEETQYRKQREKDEKELRTKQAAAPSSMSDIKEFMTDQMNEIRALRKENDTKNEQIQQQITMMNNMMTSLMQRGSISVTNDMILEQQSTQISTMTNSASFVSFTNNKISGSTDTTMTDSQFHQQNSSSPSQINRGIAPGNTSHCNRSSEDSQDNLSSTSDNSNSGDDSKSAIKELRNDRNEKKRGMKRYSNSISKEDDSIVNQQHNLFETNKIKKGTKASDNIAVNNKDIAESSIAYSNGLGDYSEVKNSKISSSTITIVTDSQSNQKNSSLLAQVAPERESNDTTPSKQPSEDSQVNLSSTTDTSNSVFDSALPLEELRND